MDMVTVMDTRTENQKKYNNENNIFNHVGIYCSYNYLLKIQIFDAKNF